MDKSIQESLLSVCTKLNRHEVEYLIVGGTAVALHGYFRMSISIAGKPATIPDLDFWYNPTYKNYFNLLKVIKELGEDVSEFENEISPNPQQSFFKLSFDTFTIDFLPQMPGLSKFRNSYIHREVAEVDGVNFLFINLDDLISSKQALAREKDIKDIEELQRRNKND